MSAVGDGFAVISIGVSCQTSMQIRYHSKLISELSGANVDSDNEFLSAKSLPFDWRVVPVPAFIRMAGRRAVFPPTLDEVSHASTGTATWEGGYFWHDQIDESTFETVVAKYRHTEDRLFATTGRRVFVLSNTQNDLELTSATHGIDFSFREDAVHSVLDAIATLFPDGTNELIVVTSEDRSVGDTSLWPAKTYLIDRSTLPPTDTIGDYGQWEQIFRNYFSSSRPDHGGQ